MAITVKSISIWRREIENRPGALSEVLKPLADAKADLKVVMGYRYPGNERKAAIEVFPVTGKKVVASAGGAGLAASPEPALLVEGDNKVGLGHTLATALSNAGINLSFLVALATGRKYSAVIGLESQADAKTATAVLKRAGSAKPTGRKRKSR